MRHFLPLLISFYVLLLKLIFWELKSWLIRFLKSSIERKIVLLLKKQTSNDNNHHLNHPCFRIVFLSSSIRRRCLFRRGYNFCLSALHTFMGVLSVMVKYLRYRLPIEKNVVFKGLGLCSRYCKVMVFIPPSHYHHILF